MARKQPPGPCFTENKCYVKIPENYYYKTLKYVKRITHHDKWGAFQGWKEYSTFKNQPM